MRQSLNFGFLVTVLIVLGATVISPVFAQGVPLQASPGAVLGSQYRGSIPGQPSLSGVIKPEDLQRRPYDPNIIQFEDGVLPYQQGNAQTAVQGVISSPDGHVYISP